MYNKEEMKLLKSKFILKWIGTIVFVLGLASMVSMISGSALWITILLILFMVSGALSIYVGLYHQLEKDIELK